MMWDLVLVHQIADFLCQPVGDKRRRRKVDVYTFDSAFSEFLHIGAGLVDDPAVQRVGMPFGFDVLHHLLRVEIAAVAIACPKERLQCGDAPICDVVDRLEMDFDALLAYFQPSIFFGFVLFCHAVFSHYLSS